MDISAALNEDQLRAAMDKSRAILVTAGAGSGKTRLLTHRIVNLVQNLGVDPYNILALTFTNKAAGEMKERLSRLLPEAGGAWISTFHSMCVRILRRDIDKIGYSKSFTIYADDDSDRVIKRIIKSENYDDDKLLRMCSKAISDAKNSGKSPDDYLLESRHIKEADLIHNVYKRYEEELKANNALDFNDLISRAYDVLSTSDSVREYYQNRFQYIHIDEFQDTDVVQYNLVKLLAGDLNNVFAVGDEDQSIYGWRGANVSNIQNFIRDFNASVFKLERNYRSTKSILGAANNIIKNNESRIPKTLWTNAETGKPLVVYKASDDNCEADYVVSAINKLHREGYKLSDFAILMRMNAMTRVIEQRLAQYNLRYKVYGGMKFFDRKEVKDILAYLKVLSNPSDNDSLLRIINYPRRGIGDAAQVQLIRYCEISGKRLFDVLTELTDSNNPDLPNALIKKVLPFGRLMNGLYKAAQSLNAYEISKQVAQQAGFMDLFDDGTEEARARKLNISDFLSGVQDFCSRRGGTLTEFLEEVTLYSEGDDDSGDAVYLSTVHSAKGMEFRVVFLVGLEEGLFPNSRVNNDPSELEEERRLMYVAVTRARELLYISFCVSRYMYGERKYQLPSRFFAEIDESLNEKLSAKLEDKPFNNYGEAGAYGHLNSGNKNGGKMSGYYDNQGGKYSSRQSSPMNAQKGGASKPQSNNNADMPVGTRIRHKRFGDGTVTAVTNLGGNSHLAISFDNGLTLTLSSQFAPIVKI